MARGSSERLRTRRKRFEEIAEGTYAAMGEKHHRVVAGEVAGVPIAP